VQLLETYVFLFQIFLLTLVALSLAQDVEVQQDIVAQAIPDQIVIADNQVLRFLVCYHRLQI
jgi:hypothetical protein